MMIGGLSYGLESFEGIQLVIEIYIVFGLFGCNSDDVNGVIQFIDKLVKGNWIVKIVVEIVLWDGLGKCLGVLVL